MSQNDGYSEEFAEKVATDFLCGKQPEEMTRDELVVLCRNLIFLSQLLDVDNRIKRGKARFHKVKSLFKERRN